MGSGSKKSKFPDVLIVTIIAVLCVAIIIFKLVFANKNDEVKSVKSIEDASHSAIAVLTGSSAESIERKIDKEKSEILYRFTLW